MSTSGRVVCLMLSSTHIAFEGNSAQGFEPSCSSIAAVDCHHLILAMSCKQLSGDLPPYQTCKEKSVSGK